MDANSIKEDAVLCDRRKLTQRNRDNTKKKSAADSVAFWDVETQNLCDNGIWKESKSWRRSKFLAARPKVVVQERGKTNARDVFHQGDVFAFRIRIFQVCFRL
jgi:hypothetical protein